MKLKVKNKANKKLWRRRRRRRKCYYLDTLSIYEKKDSFEIKEKVQRVKYINSASAFFFYKKAWYTKIDNFDLNFSKMLTILDCFVAHWFLKTCTHSN